MASRGGWDNKKAVKVEENPSSSYAAPYTSALPREKFERDAEIAGIAPEMRPINEDSPNPKKIFPKDNTNEKSVIRALTKSAISHTRMTPINPPKSDRIMASNKN